MDATVLYSLNNMAFEYAEPLKAKRAVKQIFCQTFKKKRICLGMGGLRKGYIASLF
jgi:hypothetical protein